MLFVFQMDIGQMLTFDISLLMDSVSRLQVEICKTTGISVEKQILLVSGGHSLKPDQKVMTYGAGADTNPVFLFSKLAIENQEAPLVRSLSLTKDSFSPTKEQMTDAINLPASYDTVTKRTKLACQIRDSANKILGFCNNEFKEQHLQYQGWGTVVANLEEIAQALQKTEVKFNKAVASFLPQRENHFAMLRNFNEVLELLNRIPLLKALNIAEVDEEDASLKRFGLRSSMTYSQTPKTLLDWISNQGQGQSIDALQKQSLEELLHFDSELFESFDRQVQDLLTLVISDPHQMKELVGIERRLSELEKRLNEAKKIAKEQSDIAQGFLNHQARLNSTQDAASILPDLCKSHKQQLVQMMERQQRLEALQNNFRKSKQEMSKNIHQRLGWVMHIETLISKLDSELIYHMKTLRILGCNLELLNQVKAAPQVYASMVVEAARRRKFSHVFSQWAENLAEESSHLYKEETERRKLFAQNLGEHFLLDTLFKGFDDNPPSFATKPPEPFDISLPDITLDDIVLLKNAVPELEVSLSQPLDSDVFHLPLHHTNIRSTTVVPHSQSSQTDDFRNGISTTVPCVITASETPAYSFTVPEYGSPQSAEFVTITSAPPISRETLVSHYSDQSEKETASSQKQKEPQSVVSSLNVTDSSSAELPPKVQSKVNSDTTSPISSNEFATADFYFEDSMPSPMADSPLGKKEKKKEETSKTDLELITSLHAELAESRIQIQQLERQLKEKDSQVLNCAKSCCHLETGSEGSSTLLVTADHLTSSDILVIDSGRMGDSVIPDLPDTTKLDAAYCEVTKLKTFLSETEEKLNLVQKEKDEAVQFKDNVIFSLENNLTSLGQDLSDTKSRLLSLEDEKEKLEKQLYDYQVRCENQETALLKGEETLLSIRNKLKAFHCKMKTDIPLLSRNLQELKTAVSNNKSELQVSVDSALATVEKEVSVFNATILATACSNFKSEKDALNMEINNLKASLHQCTAESSETLTHLKSANDHLASELQHQQLEYNDRLEKQKLQYEAAMKDMETKHALEVELELDRYRLELKESEETAERNIEHLKEKYQEVLNTLEGLKIQSEEEKVELLRCHKQSIQECEAKHAEEKAQMAQTFEAEHLRNETKQKKQESEFQEKLESIQTSFATDKKNALDIQKEELVSEYEKQLSQLREQHEEQKVNYAKLLEDKQLDHAEKLTLLKTQFDIERDVLQEEVNKFKNREISDASTQFDAELVSEVMTNSETQTGLELLAEVISLTSSASYGSEEMIAHKVQSTNLDEKEKDSGDISKLQQINEELNKQLFKAQEKVDQLEKEVFALELKKQEIFERNSNEADKRNEMKESFSQAMQTELPKGQDLMQISSVTTSIMVMDRELSFEAANKGDPESASSEVKAKDEKIALLEKKLKDLSLSKNRESFNDKVSIRGCDKGDIVLLCLDERHDQYVVFTVGTNLHFLHSESLECLGLQTGTDVCRKSWILAEVVDKEYCLAKKPNNRFRVPQGTCFYRVKCKPWKSDIEIRSEKDVPRHTMKSSKQENTSHSREKK
uniref:Uncharacterized protein n=1 Tax=Biomphalaria glabrata TaxID=6526 RepID=A0A2C9KMD3_BIOGL